MASDTRTAAEMMEEVEAIDRARPELIRAVSTLEDIQPLIAELTRVRRPGLELKPGEYLSVLDSIERRINEALADLRDVFEGGT